MANKFTHLMLRLLAILFLSTINPACSKLCIVEEKGALLDLKLGLDDPTGRLASWVGDDCCSWAGVGCDNRTGHVVQLDLQWNPSHDVAERLSGAFSSSTLRLQHLEYLDLSGNDFQYGPIPPFLDSFKSLRYLDISDSGFSGTIPPQIGNISGLQHLDLSGNSLSDDNKGNIVWIQEFGRLASLEFLSLSSCGLSTIPWSLPSEGFTSLIFLDLSFNNFNSTVPDWVFNIASLEHLDLSMNSFQGPIPSSIGRVSSLDFLGISSINNTAPLPKELGNLCNLKTLDLSSSNMRIELVELENVFTGCIRNSLEHLDLSSSELTGILPVWLGGIKNLKILNLCKNAIYGSIPDSIGRLTFLQELVIWSNQLNGTVPKSLGQLSSLVTLQASQNSLNGILSEAHFANLTRLQFLDFSTNSLVFDISPDWVPPFQLQQINLGPCRLGHQFPRWLQKQDNITYLDLSYAGISDVMPDWFWSLTSRLSYLDLSNNQISGRLPDSLVLADGDFVQVYLHSNNFYGQVPQVPPNVARLKLSNNSLSGQIPASISESASVLEMVSLSMNNLTGPVPSSLCKLHMLYYLDVSSNHLSGEIPNCWNQSSEHMQGLDFSNNSFSGGLPSSVCQLPSLITLHLSRNALTGELHSSLRNCTQLAVLDLSFNRFTGEIPSWMGESLPYLKILSLKANLLYGAIPPQLSQLTQLQILDLSGNHISGSIPPSFGNFSAMKDANVYMAPLLSAFINFDDYMHLIVKGMDLTYSGNLQILKFFDISGNNLTGNIPTDLGDLAGLHCLNLSKNHLIGQIPKEIGRLTQLMSLDLSRNGLTGVIPTSLGMLTSLARLNLSYNALSGEIPSVNQFLALPDPSIYAGNKDLCGFPLLRKCGIHDEAVSPTISKSKDEEGEIDWTAIGLAPGFVVGISIFSWVLLFHKKPRDAYFKLVDGFYYSLPFVAPKNTHRDGIFDLSSES